MKKSVRQKNILIVLAIIVLAVGTLLYLKPSTMPSNFYQPNSTSNDALKNYISQDLKISFKYPNGWYVDDRYQKVLITNYETNLNRDDKPSKNQIEIVLNEFSNCFKTLDEDLINPACGEGGSTKKNKIISKTIREMHGRSFYKYSVVTYNNTSLIYYFIQKGDRNLRVSKHPDPSNYEKEFDDIIYSITLL